VWRTSDEWFNFPHAAFMSSCVHRSTTRTSSGSLSQRMVRKAEGLLHVKDGQPFSLRPGNRSVRASTHTATL